MSTVAPLELLVDRTSPRWEHEVSAWSWRVIGLLVIGGYVIYLVVNPRSGPYGAETWSDTAIRILQLTAGLAAIESARLLFKAVLAMLTLLGRRPLVSVPRVGHVIQVVVHSAFRRGKVLNLAPRDQLMISSEAPPRAERRGKVMRAYQLCGWIVSVNGHTTKVEMAWRPDARVVEFLTRALAPHRIEVIEWEGEEEPTSLRPRDLI